MRELQRRCGGKAELGEQNWADQTDTRQVWRENQAGEVKQEGGKRKQCKPQNLENK